MINWIKKLLRIVRDYDSNLSAIKDRQETENNTMRRVLVEGIRLIKERTDISANVNLGNRSPNQVIVIGRYKNADYVQVYTLETNDLAHLIGQLREMQKHGVVSKIDAASSVRAIIDKGISL